MCGCSTCTTTIVSSVGPKGDAGATGPAGPTGATGPAGASYVGLTPVIDTSGSATLALTNGQSSSTVLLNRASGVAVGLPTSPPIGTYYVFNVETAASAGSYTITANGSNLVSGYISLGKAATVPTVYSAAMSDNLNTITFNGTTTGGALGTTITVTYVATNNWLVTGVAQGSGTLANPF